MAEARTARWRLVSFVAAAIALWTLWGPNPFASTVSMSFSGPTELRTVHGILGYSVEHSTFDCKRIDQKLDPSNAALAADRQAGFAVYSSDDNHYILVRRKVHQAKTEPVPLALTVLLSGAALVIAIVPILRQSGKPT